MGIPSTTSQGTKVYIADLGVAVATPAEVTTAIAGATQVGCIQDLGDLSTTLAVIRKACLSSDDISVAVGSPQLSNIPFDLIFNALDTAGQKAANDMWIARETKLFIIELNDNAGATATTITFDGVFSKGGLNIVKDDMVMRSMILEIASVPDELLATAV